MTYRTLIPMFDTLAGERIVLRPYRVEDAVDWQAAVEESREHLRDWMPFHEAFQTVEESHDWIIHRQADWLLRTDFYCGVFTCDDGRFVGGLALHPRDWDIGYFSIGYWLRASATGQGYMSEAVRLLAAYLLDTLHAQRVEIRCSEHNERSVAVARNSGFAYEGTLRNDHLDMHGQIRDSLVFSLIPEA